MFIYCFIVYKIILSELRLNCVEVGGRHLLLVAASCWKMGLHLLPLLHRCSCLWVWNKLPADVQLKDRERRVVLTGSIPKWTPVKSGVPLGFSSWSSFVSYINDIDDSVCINLLKFADDTKIFSVLQTEKDINKLQNDLVNLGRWAQDWLMLFNVD